MNSTPVFLHIHFRSGGTYLYNLFVRAGFWGYYEPFHEYLADVSTLPFSDQKKQYISGVLRHDQDSSYFDGYRPLLEDLPRFFKPSFSYDEYFLDPDADNPALTAYLNFLIEKAPARPVFKFTRSLGRLEWMRRRVPGLHIYCFRNPRAMFSSYQVGPYFDTTTLWILFSASSPGFLRSVGHGIRGWRLWRSWIRDFLDKVISIPEKDRYYGLVVLWCLSFLQNIDRSDLNWDLDQLSADPALQREASATLASRGGPVLDFSQCRLPAPAFSAKEKTTLAGLEQRAVAYLESQGFSSHPQMSYLKAYLAALGRAPGLEVLGRS